ncbi:MAG: threonine dehydratase [Alphaproteobacteria bacterium]|nr:threonine dehydratase [Alphaproteobacteria bacterium]
MLPKRDELEAAAAQVHAVMTPTLQYNWPLLAQRCGCDVWVKHENHTPIGAFKVRGGIVFMNDFAQHSNGAGIISATRGNHGQSIGFAARAAGVPATIVVPKGNSTEKNAAMKALGVRLIEHGHDFDEAREFADAQAAEEGLSFVPSFHPLLIQGVASYAMELFGSVSELDTVYVPIGLGSGICGVIAARDALNLKTRVVGVVSENAPAYALSYEAGKPVPTNSADTFADGVACRIPDAEAVAIINKGAARIVTVSENEIKDAMRAYYTDTHNLAEGAGATPLAALIKEKNTMQGRKVGLILSGGNIDTDLYGAILAGG